MNGFQLFFLWCSGTDISTLNKVRGDDTKSLQYQITYGLLVCVPTIFAFLGAIDVVSSFTSDPFIIGIAGFLFACVIFIIDRAVVTTHIKGNKKQFLARIVISIILGFLIAIFCTCLMLHSQIKQQLNTEKDAKIKITNIQYDNIDNRINSKLQGLNDKRACLNELITYEQAGKDTTLACGTSSNKPGQSHRFKELKHQISDLDNQIENEQKRINIDSERNREERTARLAEINNESYDALSELMALFQIAQNRHIAWVLIIALYLLLMTLDIIPVLIKELSQETRYDTAFRNTELTGINFDKAKAKAQENYDSSITTYEVPLDKHKINDYFEWSGMYIIGIVLGLIPPILFYTSSNEVIYELFKTVNIASIILSITLSLIANYLYDFFKQQLNKKKYETQ